METSRRDFLKAAALVAAAPVVGRAAVGATSNALQGHVPGGGKYPYLGRTEDYRDWSVVPRGLTIAKVETFRRNMLALVKVTTVDGSVGWGQVAPYEANITADVLHQLVARRVLGKDIADIDAINDEVVDANMKWPWSAVCRAVSGVDTAIWDLYGQLLGKPVAELLGGTVRPLVAYGSSMRRDISPADEAARMARLKDEMGYRAFKLRLGTPTGHNRDASPGRSEAIIPAVRKAVGDDVELFADANSCYTPDVAIEFGHRLEDANYAMYEEPCPYWELEWTREVTQALKIDVSGGEQDNDMAQWRRMIAMGAVDIVQPDICYVGGLTRAWRVAKMAEAAGIVTKPHAANVSLVTVFTMHMLAALPKGGEVEFSIEADAGITKEARAMFEPALEVKEGKAVMPEGPGWGIRVKEEWLASAERKVTER